jgi:hypothetical protein
MSSSFNNTSRPWPGRRGGGTRCLLTEWGIGCSCAATAGVVRWTDHSGAAAGGHESEGRHQREEQPGRFGPTRRPCSLARQSIVEDQARWDQWRRLAGGTLALQARDRGRGKGERRCKQAGQWTDSLTATHYGGCHVSVTLDESTSMTRYLSSCKWTLPWW